MNKTVMMTRSVSKGERIYPGDNSSPVAVAEENIASGDVGVIDDSIIYPVLHNNKLLMLPGLKKKLFSASISLKKNNSNGGKLWRKRKKKK